MIRLRLPLCLWRWWRRRKTIAGPASLSPEALDDADLPLGPGWFDSSWDLKRGLDVREGLPANASVNEWVMGLLGPATPPEAMGPLLPAQEPPQAPVMQDLGPGEPQWELSPA